MELKPEEKIEIVLWDWLKTKSNNIKEVYFNRKNKLNWKVFTTSGINAKPDLIISFNRGFGMEYIAVEVKDSSSSRNIHDSGKILNYYENFILEKTRYFIYNKPIHINHFAVASNNSELGFLFEEDNILISNEKSSDEWRKKNSELNLIPKFEYQRTSDYIRRLWAEWRVLKKRLKLDKKKLSSIGIIICNPTINDYPYYQNISYIDYLEGKKSQWSQRFWRL